MSSFWDNYTDEGGGFWLTAAEKAALIENEVVLTITNVRFDDKNQYQGRSAPRYIVTFLVPNPLTGETEERGYGFALNPEGSSRDRLLEALTDYLGSEGAEEVNVTLEKVGTFVAIRKADA